MKVLEWMHRALRQGGASAGGDVFKDHCGRGGSCFCLIGVVPPAVDDLDGGCVDDDLFAGSGLLSIGTLGQFKMPDPIQEEQTEDEAEEDDDDDHSAEAGEQDTEFFDGAATPCFSFTTSVDAIAEKAADATTESDLMFVSAELEKVLASEGDDRRLSSARPSFSISCPLQGYLFNSPVGAAERRVSLGELFKRTRFAEEGAGGDAAVAGEGAGGGRGVGVEMMKGKGSDGGDRAGTKGSTTKDKLQKILQMFHRKVYPESTAAAIIRRRRKRMGSSGSASGNADGAGVGRKKGAGMIGKGWMPKLGCFSKSALGSPGSVAGGHWIKTDADYVVLEL